MQTKSVLKSTTVRGALIMLLPTVLKLFGVEISQEEIDLLGQNLDVLVEAVTALVGFVVAIYGRWNATKPLSLT